MNFILVSRIAAISHNFARDEKGPILSRYIIPPGYAGWSKSPVLGCEFNPSWPILQAGREWDAAEKIHVFLSPSRLIPEAIAARLKRAGKISRD